MRRGIEATVFFNAPDRFALSHVTAFRTRRLNAFSPSHPVDRTSPLKLFLTPKRKRLAHEKENVVEQRVEMAAPHPRSRVASARRGQAVRAR